MTTNIIKYFEYIIFFIFVNFILYLFPTHAVGSEIERDITKSHVTMQILYPHS